MSVCAQTEEESGAEEMGAPGRDIYEQKAVSKVVRVLTVLAYLLSVSLAAILLSVYYVCVWRSPDLPPANDTLEVQARRADQSFYHDAPALFVAGGSNTSVSDNATLALANSTESFSATDAEGLLASEADPYSANSTAYTDSAADVDDSGVT